MIAAAMGLGFARSLVNVNAAFARGWLNVVMGRRVRSWESDAG